MSNIALHGYYNPAELRIRLLAYGEKADVALPVPPKDTLVYPNPSMNYVMKSVHYAKFLEMFDEHLNAGDSHTGQLRGIRFV